MKSDRLNVDVWGVIALAAGWLALWWILPVILLVHRVVIPSWATTWIG